MRAIIQRVTSAKVNINEQTVGKIHQGLLVLIGITGGDTHDDIEWLVRKVTSTRIFADEEGKMNLSIKDIKGELLIVSQFTLHASTKKGNRPSFTQAAHPDIAIPLYEKFIQQADETMGKKSQTGKFGADMQIQLTNDGPVTLMIDSKLRE